MNLESLLQEVPVLAWHGPRPGGEITGLAYDSRRVEPGMLFAALPGSTADGHHYLAAAAGAGAVAALVERVQPGLADFCQVQVEHSRRALARAACAFYGHPSRGLTLVGITGTNGKTTVSWLVESILAQGGKTGLVGTVEVRFAGRRRPAEHTTPQSVDLQALLAEMAGAGVQAVVMEVSSHALEQQRVEGTAFDLALFTNLSRDHLDYHGDMESYWQAKRRLFFELLPQARRAGKDPAAVICSDDARGRELARELAEKGIRVLTYGLEPGARVQGRDLQGDLEGGRVTMCWPQGELELRTALVGRYNLQNCLAAGAAGLALGLEPGSIRAGIRALAGVPGRLERVAGPPGRPAVFVDYSHTPEALAGALEVLRPLTRGRLWCVFGAGGDRDRGKRPLMGRAAGRGADLVVLTSDNPRSEDPLAIMAMIEPGLLAAGCSRLQAGQPPRPGGYLAEPDRARAIALALREAGPDDVVLIAGKGHEDYQIIGRRKLPFDDRREAARHLAAGEGRHAQAES